MEEEKNIKRLDYIDFMNIFASFAVVVMHCSGMVFEYAETFSWGVSLILQSVSHFAVPAFFMITGTTLLEYKNKYDTVTFFKKRFKRTVIPFLFWSVFYIFFRSALNLMTLPSFFDGIKMILSNNVLNIFWFFYEIFGVYLSIPVISLIARKSNFRQIEYFCCLFFLFRSIYPLFTKGVVNVTGYLVPAITLGSIGYVFMGFLIKYEEYSNKKRYTIYTVGLISLMLMIFGTYFISRAEGNFNKVFFDYYSVACMPYSFAVMLLFKHIEWKKLYKVIPQKLITSISSTCFGVYLLHMAFIMARNSMPFMNSVSPSILMVCTPPVVYVICVVLSLLIRKIPFIKNIIP